MKRLYLIKRKFIGAICVNDVTFIRNIVSLSDMNAIKFTR